MVLSFDPETGETAYKEVLNTFIYVKDTLVYVEVNGETIETTTEHPFWVEGQGWTKAKFLETGNQLRDKNGNAITIENVDIVPLPENQYTLVYNFEVADFHTYYVADSYVLVHNNCDEINWKGFSSKKKKGLTGLQRHYQKHVVNRGEFGGATKLSQNDYLKLAKKFAGDTGEKIQRAKVGKFYVKYDPESRFTFVGHTGKREIRTFYQADLSIAADPFAAAQEYAKGLI